MAKVNIIVELNHNKRVENNAAAGLESAVDVSLDISKSQKLDKINYDEDFAAVKVPELSEIEHPEEELFDTNANFEVSPEPEDSTYIVRGTIEESDIPKIEKEVEKSRSVANIYADVTIEPMIICPGSAPLGTANTVENLLCTSKMHSRNMDGRGVLVAIVDTGVNMAYLNSKGKNPVFDVARSWTPNPNITPGSAPVGHGTMCAYDVSIAAPKCTILDIALLQSTASGPTVMSGFLSDAIKAYSHLYNVMKAPRRPGELRSLVVNNSWGMFHPSWDFPVGHPGNYSDNPNHPFNKIVGTLERAGADILFAAGNCGANCPDGRCQGVTTKAIYGANSSPFVTCVAGVDTTKKRVGYSSIGPGRLTIKKPDISGYTHFAGSGVYAADGGTSAACPVVAGVVAAVRSRKPYSPTNSSTKPSVIRNLITTTAQDLGANGYDFQHGYGVINGCRLADKFPIIIRPVPHICIRYPWICRGRRPPIIDICKRYPQLCRRIPIPRPRIPIPRPPFRRFGLTEDELYNELDQFDSFLSEEGEELDSEEISELLSYFLEAEAEEEGGDPYDEPKEKVGDCGCGRKRKRKRKRKCKCNCNCGCND